MGSIVIAVLLLLGSLAVMAAAIIHGDAVQLVAGLLVQVQSWLLLVIFRQRKRVQPCPGRARSKRHDPLAS